MSVKIQFRRGTATQWSTANTLLAAGEPGLETDTGKIKYGDGTSLWNSLPYYAQRIDINDLGDVVITSPTSGQVLKYNGTNWINDADATGGGGGTGATYAISSETVAGGANLRLTGSDSSVDNVKFASGSNVTVTRTDANTITISSTSTAGLTAVHDDPAPILGGHLDLGGNYIKDGVVTLIALSGSDLNLTPTGIVNLPAGSKVGGVTIGSLSVKGTVADYTALTAIVSPASGDAYVVLDPTPTHLWVWNSTSWVDLGQFQGPSGSGVPSGGATGQALVKIDNTDYNTTWGTLATVATTGAYADLSGKPTLFSGAYADLTGKPTLFSGAYADLTGKPTLATVATSGSYADLTSKPTIPTNIDSLTDVVITSASSGQVLKYDGTNWVNGTDSTGGGGGGTGLGARSTAAATTSSLANNATDSTQAITGFKTYALLKIQTSAASWVRLYTDAASRTADASRLQGVDPAAGAGVIAEVITTGNQTIIISPGTIGFNNETIPTTAIPLTVTNLSGGAAAITVTVTLVQLEA